MKEDVFKKFRSALLKRAFSVEGDGMCVRLSVAEKALKEAIEESFLVQEPPRYNFWDEPM